MPQLNLGLMKTRKDTMRVLNEFILELVREVEGGFAYKPSNKWLLMVQQHLGLLEKLASHEAMQANMEQLGSDIKGAASKDRVFFMWTYIGETLVSSFPRSEWINARALAAGASTTLCTCIHNW